MNSMSAPTSFTIVPANSSTSVSVTNDVDSTNYDVEALKRVGFFLGPKGKPLMTTFIKANIISNRVSELENGAEPAIETDDHDVYRIAKLEFEKGVIPAVVTHVLPDGNVVYIPFAEYDKSFM